ncbi:MAG TPA: globin domain-containing protein [Polyangiaceae bacterium]|nr:globin domain-containing protein [Polyangiaceae bacterium]
MALNVQLLRDSFSLVVEREPQVTSRFYKILFERYPQARPLFSSKAIEHQEKMLRDMLVAVVDHLEDEPWLKEQLAALGEKHVDYGVTPEMYGWVGACLLQALQEAAGADWSPEIEKAWADAYGAIASIMQAGAQRSAAN